MTAVKGSRDSVERRFAASKVPQITLLFWVAKLLTTGMGETRGTGSTWRWAKPSR
jgi:uncharacterized membrane-anchored protein